MAFRILTLSGGGARGVFQAHVACSIEKQLGQPIRECFDLIAATSTGALVGAALALGRPAETITDLYHQHGHDVFRPRRLGVVRRGPRYKSQTLQRLLTEVLGDAKLGDLPIQLLVCTSVLNTFEGRVFSKDDDDISVVDVVMASAAAPTYFSPVSPYPHKRGYIDGGLWANDPSIVAIDHVVDRLRIAPETIRMLSIGTGRVAHGQIPEYMGRLRTFSPSTLRFMRESSTSLQSWFTETRCASRLERDQMIRVNPTLPKWIALDDVSGALRTLPGLAESEFEGIRDRLPAFLEHEPATPATRTPGPARESRLRDDTRAVVEEYRAEAEDLRSALERVARRSHVPHRIERRYRFEVGLDPESDRSELEVTIAVEEGSSVAWRTEHFGLTQTLNKYPFRPESTVIVTTDPGREAKLVALDEGGGLAGLLILFDPPLIGPGTLAYTMQYDWPGMWDPLRAEGRDRAEVVLGPEITAVEVTFVFPPAARGLVVTSPRGEVRSGREGSRPTRTWKLEGPPADTYRFHVEMEPL